MKGNELFLRRTMKWSHGGLITVCGLKQEASHTVPYMAGVKRTRTRE